MKATYLIWLSALALIILVISQYVIITETYETKKARIESKFSSLVKAGLYNFEDMYYGFAMDSLYNGFDEQALGYLVTPVNSDSIFDFFSQSLNNFTVLDQYVAFYLKQNGEEPEFHSSFQIRTLSLIDLEEDKLIYIDTAMTVPVMLKDPLLASSYTVERNYFRMSFDYFISIDHITGMIMNDMRLTLILALFAIAVIFLVFFMTLRNMLIQKRLSDLKSDFINNMTHELKTPLSTISVASSSLINPDLTLEDKRIQELSSMIKRQNKHLSDLIDRILDISIWEKDEVKIRRKRVDIASFFKGIIDAFHLEYGENDVTVNVSMDIEHAYVYIDDIHMTTVVNNIFINALKYSNSKPNIDINIKSNAFLQIQISDNGPGIRKDEQKHVFEKFYRGNDSKLKAIKGLGLGLYYVRQIVEAHKGIITLKSEEGKGSTFHIKIPMNHEHPAG